MKILDTGDKIKKLRIEIGLKQEDLANDEVTRSLISMIENNKRNLTYNTARIISAKLNQYYVNLGKEITPDFLLETKPEQAERLIKEELEKMQALLKNPVQESAMLVEDSIQKLINFAKDWQLDLIIAQLHEARGEFYYNTYQYNSALKDLFTAQEYYLKERKYERVATTYNFIGTSYYSLMLYEQALLYYNQAQQLIMSHDLDDCDVVKMRLVYNKILCYRRLKQYNLAFIEIANYRALPYYTKEHYLKVLIVEANTHSDLRNYDKAIQLYERLLTKYEKLLSDLTLLVYINYAEALRRKGAYEESLEKIMFALNHKGENDPSYAVDLLLNSAQIYLISDKINEAIDQINQGLILAEKINDINLTIELHLLHVKAQVQKEDFYTAEAILYKLENFIKEGTNLSEKLLDIQIHFLLLYSQAKNFDKCTEHIHKIYELRNTPK